MVAGGWLALLVDQAGVSDLEAHRAALLANGADPVRADAEMASAVELLLLLQERRRRAVEMAVLNDIASRLAAVTDPAGLLIEVVDQARRLLTVDLTYLALLDDSDLRIEVASGDRSDRLVGIRLPRHAGLAGAVATSGSPRWTSDYATDDELVHEEGADRAAEAESIRGLVGVPLAVRGRVLGVLLAAKREERRFAPHEVNLLTALAAHAAVAIDKARAASELRDAKETLETTLRLDADLTRTVLTGGDTAALVERIRGLSDVAVRWVEHPDAGAIGSAIVRADEPRLLHVDGSAVQPVTAAGQLFGALVVDEAVGSDGTVAPDVALLLERAAPLIALTLVGARATARAVQLGRDIAAIDLLSRAESDDDADRRRWRGAGLDPRREHVVVVVEGDPEAARRYVTTLGLGEHSATAAYRDRLVLVAPAELDIASRWVGARAPVAGLSGIVADPGGLRAAYADASRTARALTALGRTGGLARAADLGVFAVLLSRTGQRDLHEQIERELGAVLAYEASRGVPLTETLEAFLEQGRRPTATASTLRVHVNTVYQRLTTLDALLGPDWRDRALELQVLLRLRRAVHALDEA